MPDNGTSRLTQRSAVRVHAARRRWHAARPTAVSLGKPAEGLRHFELAAKLANPAVALSVGARPDVHGTAYAAVTCQMRNDLPGLTEAASELRELCDRYDFAYYREWGGRPGWLVLPGR